MTLYWSCRSREDGAAGLPAQTNQMVFVTLYLLSFPLMVYENFFAVRLTAERSRLARSSLFFLAVLVITFGSVAGLWYQYGWREGIAVLAVSWAVNTSTMRFFFRRHVHRTAERLFNSESFEPTLAADERLKKAHEVAERVLFDVASGK